MPVKKIFVLLFNYHLFSRFLPHTKKDKSLTPVFVVVYFHEMGTPAWNLLFGPFLSIYCPSCSTDFRQYDQKCPEMAQNWLNFDFKFAIKGVQLLHCVPGCCYFYGSLQLSGWMPTLPQTHGSFVSFSYKAKALLFYITTSPGFSATCRKRFFSVLAKIASTQ